MTRRDAVVTAGAVACHVLTVERDDGTARTYYQLVVPRVGVVAENANAAAHALRSAAERLRQLAEQVDDLAAAVEMHRA